MTLVYIGLHDIICKSTVHLDLLLASYVSA